MSLIVIIDDVPKNLQILGSILKSNGYRVLALTDSKKAIRTIEKKNPDLILLDIMMPDIDGYEICKGLKVNPATKHIPIIFLTAKIESNDIIKGFQLGAVDYITKPFNREELLVRVKTQLDLQDAIKQAQKANAAKSEFLANISHDIRSPMNAIMTVMELMLRTNLTPEQSNYIQMAKKSGTSLLCLINDILDLSKIEAGELELDSIQFDLRETLEDISDIFSIEAYKKGLDFACIIDPNISKPVIGDQNRLKQIIINLISNAIKFTSQGDVVIHLSHHSNHEYTFSIRDTGKGIPSHQIDKLFKPYSQLDTSITKKYGGTGLGLAISKQLVEKMNGHIHVQSEEHKGSVFSFTVNFTESHESNLSNHTMINVNQTISALIIDQHAHSRKSLVNQIRTFNCLAYESYDAESTLTRLEKINSAQQICHVVFIDKETYHHSIRSIMQLIKMNRAINQSKFILVKKIIAVGDKTTQDFDWVMTKPIRYNQLVVFFNQFLDSDTSLASHSPLSNQSIPNQYDLDASPYKILIIDDEEINVAFTQNMLLHMGYQVEVALSAHDALQKLSQTAYDIILTDLQMPQISGIELTSIVRNIESQVKNHHALIIALTASAMKKDKYLCLEAGMDDYLTKPFSPGQLQYIIEKNLKKKIALKTDHESNTHIELKNFLLSTEGNEPNNQRCLEMEQKGKEKEELNNISQINNAHIQPLCNKNNLLNRLKKHKPLIIQMINNYLLEREKYFKTLESAIMNQSYQEIIFIAHKLKGETANLSCAVLSELYQTINNAANEKNMSLIKEKFKEACILDKLFIKEIIDIKQKLSET